MFILFLHHKPDYGNVPIGHDIKTSAVGCGKYSLKECSWVQNPNTIDPYSQKYIGRVRGRPMLETVPHHNSEGLTNPVCHKPLSSVRKSVYQLKRKGHNETN